jgi:uncharacterized protein YsxB (DUF464 family)
MIHLWVKLDRDNNILEMTLDGHAEFSERGADIVCAAVSALSIGIVNSIEQFLGIELNPIDEEEEGFMWIRLPHNIPSEKIEQLQLLLKTLAFSIRGIADQYPDYVHVIEELDETITL